jgi:penicillin-binding protein 1A
MIKKFNGYTSRLKYPDKGNYNNPLSKISLWGRDLMDEIQWRFKNYRVIAWGVLVGIIVAFMVIVISDFYRVKALAVFQPSITTKIYDKNGLLISELFREKRDVVKLGRLPENLVRAFVAIEDSEFYDHFGINIKGIVRAFFINVFSGRIRQGGSTITQQLSKILLTSRKRNIYRKVKEAFIAVMIEMYYTKGEILELYLNQIFLGHGTYGVESASRFYFEKHVWDLNLAESALLASLPSAPNRLSPIRHPKIAMERHKIVLARMVEMGYISIEEAERAYLSFWPGYLSYINELPPTMNTWSARINKAPWFTEYVRRKLISKYGEEMVYEKGLLVYTTLDLKKQIAGQRILKRSLENRTKISRSLSFKNEDYVVDNYSDMVEIFSLMFDVKGFLKRGSRKIQRVNDYLQKNVLDEFEGLNYLVGFSNIDRLWDSYKAINFSDKEFMQVEGCIVSIDHRNGYIEAMIGGSEFSSINQLNRVLQSRRQPGSAIKPLIYSAAIESGKFTPATAILDSPVVFLDNEGGDWIPENYEGEFYGLLRLRRALAMSINVISVRISETLGIDYIMRYLAKLLRMDGEEAKSRIPRNFSIALGSIDVSPLELARAYAIIANGGKDVIPFGIRYVKDQNGKILENREKEVNDILEKGKRDGTIQVLRPETAQVLISMLRTVITAGTGRAASIGRPAGGKTGTTNNWKDAWFVGFVPQLTTCIWVGYDKLGLSLGIGQSGGAVVAPTWSEYMREVLKDERVLGFPTYANLETHEICSHSGLLPSSSCRKVIEEVFIPGTVPEKECELCKNIIYDIEVTKREPLENISQDQKTSILKNLKGKKKSSRSILNSIGNDLLD